MPAYNDLEKSKKRGEDRRTWPYAPFVGREWMNRADRRLCQTLSELEQYLLDFQSNGTGRIAVDTETSGLNERRHLVVGISLSWQPLKGIYIPLRHQLSPLNLPVDATIAMLNQYLTGYRCLMFNSEFDAAMMIKDGFTTLLRAGGAKNELDVNAFDDVQIMAFLYDPNFGPPGLKHMARYVLGYEMVSYVEAVLNRPEEKITKRDRKKLPTMNQLEPEQVYSYAVDDAIVTFLLDQNLWPSISGEKQMSQVYEILKRSLICKRRLQYTPLPIDLNYVDRLERDICEDLASLEIEIHQLAGMAFKVTSTHQLVPVLERIGVPLIERTATGQIKTGYDDLAPHRKNFEIVDRVMSHREQSKALGFVKAVRKCGRRKDPESDYTPLNWPMQVGPDFPYVLVSYNNVAVNTLRFSSSGKRAGTEDSIFHKLNIQQMPKPEKKDMRWVELALDRPVEFLDVVDAQSNWRVCGREDEKGKPFPCQKCEHAAACRILDAKVEYPIFMPDARGRMPKNFRRLWLPYPGHQFLHADFKAQEIMLAIYLSGEDNWLRALDEGKDLHKMTASLVHGIPYEEVTKAQRGPIKTITFALLYGSHGNSIARNIGISEDEAADLVNRILKSLPQLKEWMDSCVDKMYMHRDRAITNLYGYERPMGWWLDSEVPSLVRKAERSAINTVIQSTCACVARIAFSRLYRMVHEAGLDDKAIILSSVHDEFNMSVHPDAVPQAARIMSEAMTGFDLPGLPAKTKGRRLMADLSVGPSWGQQVPYEPG